MNDLVNTEDCFVLYRPKEIVSGDFYHFSTAVDDNGQELLYVCTADCTGHGVPGALMSILAISRLNEAIGEKGLRNPAAVFDQIREGIINSMNQEGNEVESKDGMDAVLYAVNFRGLTLQAAASNNPLWILRDRQFMVVKPDKMPIGKSFGRQDPFTLHELDLRRGDIIYTFTDGYADQFGGPNGKKFKYRPLQELLLSMHDRPMKEQCSELAAHFDRWKGDLEQVDDVLMIGLRI